MTLSDLKYKKNRMALLVFINIEIDLVSYKGRPTQLMKT